MGCVALREDVGGTPVMNPRDHSRGRRGPGTWAVGPPPKHHTSQWADPGPLTNPLSEPTAPRRLGQVSSISSIFER